VSDEIFTWPIAGSPYTIAAGGPITGNFAGGDLPWMAYSWRIQTMSDPVNPGSGLTWTNCTYWFRNNIIWQDGAPFTVDDINYTLWIDSVYSTAYGAGGMRLGTNQNDGANFAPEFVRINDYTCSIYVNSTSFLSLYYPLYAVEPYHVLKYINFNVTAAENGATTGGLNGVWPGQGAASSELLDGAPFTYTELTTDPGSTLVGTGPFSYREGSATPGIMTTPGGGITLDAFNEFFLTTAPGAISLKATWTSNLPSAQPAGVYYKVGLPDLVLLANAYGTHGYPPSVVSLAASPGTSHAWNPAADLAAPAGVIGLSDLVTLATHYGWYYGNYSYNAPYPPAEVTNGGPGAPGGPYRFTLTHVYIGALGETTVTITSNQAVDVRMNGVFIGNTGSGVNVTISSPATFTFPGGVGGHTFEYCDINDPSGIGIHAGYS
jgi:hypothetical protein